MAAIFNLKKKIEKIQNKIEKKIWKKNGILGNQMGRREGIFETCVQSQLLYLFTFERFKGGTGYFKRDLLLVGFAGDW